MGASGNNIKVKSKEPIEPLNNQEESLKDFQLTCSECSLIPKILEINYYNYSIKYECPKHGIKEENIKEYFELSKEYLYKNNQNNNSENSNDEGKKQIFYYCLNCKNFLCKQCQNNHEHKEFIKINDPESKIDIHLNNYNKYCICNKPLYDNKEINCKIKEKISKDSKLLQKLKDKNIKLKEKRENRNYMIKLLDILINMYTKKDLNHLNNNNIIKASEKINEKKNERLYQKLKMIKDKMDYYLKIELGIIIEDKGIELKLNNKHLCNIDLLLLNKMNKNFENIEYLNLENNNINNIDILNKIYLPNLKNVNLKGNIITNILNLKDIFEVNKNIERLNLSHNKIQKNKVNVNEINENTFQYVIEIKLDGNNQIKQEIEAIEKILNLNKKIRNGEGCTLKYQIEDKNKDIRIFGSEFVKNNIDKCKIIIKGEEINLLENYKVEEGENNDNFLYVKLIFIEDIDNISNIFDGCKSLLSISDISNWNISKVTKMDRLFNECKSLKSLPDIGQWDILNVTSMERLFSQCESLKSLPDISQWDTLNVTSMERLFNQCVSLESLPDLEQWDTTNVTNMNYLFFHCNSLKSLPNIGKWNLSNANSMFSMFGHCQSLSSLPDISRLNISNVINLSNLFEGCSSLISLPDISNWDTSNVEDMAGMFADCESLEKLPDISKWKTSNVVEMDNMFKGCKNLKGLPDISEWDINKVEDMNNMFNGCVSLKSVSLKSKWDLSKVNQDNMFEGCEELKDKFCKN